MNTSPVACEIDVAYGAPSPAGLPVSLGVPFPKGSLADPAPLAVTSPSGEIRPAAFRDLVRHRDGSVRWALVSFGAREAGRHRLVTEPGVRAETAPGARLTRATVCWIATNSPVSRNAPRPLQTVRTCAFDRGSPATGPAKSTHTFRGSPSATNSPPWAVAVDCQN